MWASGAGTDTLQIVKVLDPGESAAEHEITEVDRGVVSVLNALRRVDAQVQRLEEQIAG